MMTAVPAYPLTIHPSSRKIQPYEIIYNVQVTMARYRITYWKHIPQSFIVEGEGRTIKKQLSQRIQNAIDTYAMVEGITATSDYAAQYKRGEWLEREGSPEAVAEAVFRELETEFAKIDIPRRNGNSGT